MCVSPPLNGEALAHANAQWNTMLRSTMRKVCEQPLPEQNISVSCTCPPPLKGLYLSTTCNWSCCADDWLVNALDKGGTRMNRLDMAQ